METKLCYTCNIQTEESLCKPCNNPSCDGRAHASCLQKEVKFTKFAICKSCKNPLIIKTSVCEFNRQKWVTDYIKTIYVYLLAIFGTIYAIYLALGANIFNDIAPDNVNKQFSVEGQRVLFVLSAMLTMLCTIPLGFIFIQCPSATGCRENNKGCGYDIFSCKSIRSKLQYKSYITMGIMYIFTNLLVASLHIIGYQIYKYKFGENLDAYFTWKTYGLGLLTSVLVLAFFGIIYSIVKCFEYCIHRDIKIYTQKITIGTLE